MVMGSMVLERLERYIHNCDKNEALWSFSVPQTMGVSMLSRRLNFTCDGGHSITLKTLLL